MLQKDHRRRLPFRLQTLPQNWKCGERVGNAVRVLGTIQAAAVVFEVPNSMLQPPEVRRSTIRAGSEAAAGGGVVPNPPKAGTGLKRLAGAATPAVDVPIENAGAIVIGVPNPNLDRVSKFGHLLRKYNFALPLGQIATAG